MFHNESETLPLKEFLIGNNGRPLLIFLGACGLVLLIACANVANLLLIRASARRQEIAIRYALGAGRGRLIRQLLTESTLVSLVGGAAALLLASWAVPLLISLAPSGKIPRVDEIHIDGWVLAFTFGLSLVTGVAFGLAPAFQGTQRMLRQSLSRARGGLRGPLVVAEIALSLVLLAGAGLLTKSFLRLRAVDPGFRPHNVLTMSVSLPDAVYRTKGKRAAFHERLLAKVAAIPGVASAGAVNFMPLASALVRGDFKMQGGPPPKNYIVDKPAVSPDYFRTVGIRLLSGRAFTAGDDADGPGVVVVSQSVAREIWPGENPLGKRISMRDQPKAGDWLTVVGVVQDVRQQELTAKPGRAIYQPIPQAFNGDLLSSMTFLARTAADPRSMAPA